MRASAEQLSWHGQRELAGARERLEANFHQSDIGHREIAALGGILECPHCRCFMEVVPARRVEFIAVPIGLAGDD